jgi:hypothetical protein
MTEGLNLMDRGDLIGELQRATDDIADALEKIPQDLFTIQPEPNVWSPRDIAEHLIQLDSATVFILKGKTHPEEGRDPAVVLERVSTDFGDFEKKFSTFGPGIPKGVLENREETIEKFRKTRSTLTRILEKEELDRVCEAFEHGIFGFLTRVEWGWFVVIHSDRHLNQIQRTHQRLLDQS